MDFPWHRAATLAALFLLAMVSWVGAQDVTLTSRDGLITLQGSLQSYDGELFRVETKYGLLTLDGHGVRCVGPGCPDLTDYVAEVGIAAPLTTAGLIPALIDGFAAAEGYLVRREMAGDLAVRYVLRDQSSGQEVARLNVTLANSDQGLADLQSGKADLALSLQSLPGLPGTAQVLALDAAVPVVSRSNPLQAISIADLQAALSGKVTSWREIGGSDAPIVLHALESSAGLLQAAEAKLAVKTAASAHRHGGLEALVDAVARDPWALGLASASDLGNARALTLTGECGFRSAADRAGIRSGDYPLVVPLYLYGSDQRQAPLVRELSAWLTTPQAQAAVAASGFVDLRAGRVDLAQQGERLAHAISTAPVDGLPALQAMVAGLAGSVRLSTTFRFEAGSRTLDAPSRSALATLARDLEAGVHDKELLTFVGFSDGRGERSANLRLSQQRAEAVRQAVLGNAPLLDAKRVTLQVAAYGDALPVACDDSEIGAGLNRRVEVWLRPQPTDSPPSGN